MPSALLAAADVPPLFSLLAVMLTAVVVVSLLLLRVRQSLLVGYFCCGILISNAGVVEFFGGEDTEAAVAHMAEFGVMLLMFVLGMEFSVSELRYLRRPTFVGGGLEMAICGLAAAGAALFFGVPWPGAILLGVALGMSSTAVSLKTFQDMGLAGTPGARFALGVAIFQDLFIIAFLVFVPLLLDAGAGERAILPEIGWLFVRGAAFMLLAWVNGRWIVPRLLRGVTGTRSRELFTLTVVGCCVGLAWLGSLLGLSLALGAFVAGLAVSESIYKHRILADVTPIKDIFLTLFFVSVGLLIDVGVALENWRGILAITAALIAVKAAIIAGIAYALGHINRHALVGALSLCSAGEFSLILLQKAAGSGFWDASVQQMLVAAGAISMGLVPGLMRLADPASRWMAARNLGRLSATSDLKAVDESLPSRVKHLRGHAVICGFGPVGRALNQAMLRAGLPTLIVELNAETARRLRSEGQPVLFADAAHEETWSLARVEDAAVVAFTFPEASVAAAALHPIRARNREICVIARTRFASDVIRLEKLGVNVVVHDEGEAARSMVDHGFQIAVSARPGKA
ncbi:MAG: cation:proton antiporter [Verrucomicrobiales bacterium]